MCIFSPNPFHYEFTFFFLSLCCVSWLFWSWVHEPLTLELWMNRASDCRLLHLMLSGCRSSIHSGCRSSLRPWIDTGVCCRDYYILYIISYLFFICVPLWKISACDLMTEMVDGIFTAWDLLLGLWERA